MDVHVLGPMSVVGDDGEPVPLGGAKQRSILAILALRPNTLVSVDQLAEGVWGEDVPDRYVQNVQVYVSTLRRLLEPGRTASMPSRILGRGPGYELVLADEELDLARFRDQAARGSRALETGQPATAAELLRAALAEWRGEPCGDLAFQPFTEALVRPLREERATAFESCIAAELACGRSAELVAELEAAVGAAPHRERLWEHLVTALYRAGRQADALGACRRARELLVEELGLDPGPRLRALEEQVLVHAPELDALARTAVRTARIPVPLTSLVGREAAVSDVLAGLREARLVVLTGPGGVGKTRVALAVAADAVGLGRTVFFADLSTVRDPARVLAALAASLGLGDTAAVDDVAAAAEAAGALVVIDNFEQVVDAAGVVGDVVARAPSARALVTSRTRLGLPGERVVPVEPLPVHDGGDGPATRLFWERAREIDGRLDPAAHGAAAAAICRSLDGMPLAIELAASRVGVLDPGTLAERLRDAVVSIVDVGTDARRHGSLRAAIRWSTELLAPGERALFRVLSVCESAVDLATVTALAAVVELAPRDAERALEGLVRSSLVRSVETSAGRRFGFLTTTRAVAGDELEAGTEQRARAAHAAWFARRTAEHPDDDASSSTARAEADLTDAAAALRHLARHDDAQSATAMLNGLLAGAIRAADHYGLVRSLATGLAAMPGLPAHLVARAKVTEGAVAYIQGDLDEAARLLTAIADLAPDDHVFRARAAVWCAANAADAADHPAAVAAAGLARAQAEASGDQRLLATTLSVSSYVALAAGDPESALAYAERRLGAERAGSYGEADALPELVRSLLSLDRVDQAAVRAHEMLLASLRLGVPHAKGEAYRYVSWCALLQGDHSTAAACLLEQLRIYDRNDGLVSRIAEIPFVAGIAVALAGSLDDGRRLWAGGRRIFDERRLTIDFTANLLRLAERLGLPGGESTPGDLDAVVADTVTTLETVRNAGQRGS